MTLWGREQILGRAKNFLAGRAGVIETVRAISAVSDGDDAALVDTIRILSAIDSETDTLPIGSVRDLWQSEALLRADREVTEAETLYRTAVVDACRTLVDLLEPDEGKS